MINTKI